MSNDYLVLLPRTTFKILFLAHDFLRKRSSMIVEYEPYMVNEKYI